MAKPTLWSRITQGGSKEKERTKDITDDDRRSRDSNTNEEQRKKKTRPVPATTDNLKTARLLQPKQLLLGQFEVIGLINGGGFAQIYLAYDKKAEKECVVKVESDLCDRRRMKLEMTLLMLLRGRMHIPELLGLGTAPGAHFLVLQMVGRNLSDLRRQMPGKKLGDATLFRAMEQIGTALSLIHGAGFLHRDLKPSNCCIGATDVGRFYLLDYGLTRSYIDGTGAVRNPRLTAGLRGTMRYISLDGHLRKEFGPCSDLVAFLYSTIELGEGCLPWTRRTQEDAIYRSKMATTPAQLCHGYPELVPLAEYIMSLEWNSIPDYPKILRQVQKCKPAGTTNETPYDWELHPVILEHKIQPEDASVVTATGVTTAKIIDTLHDPVI